jgi:uncharacterized protein
LPSRTLAWRGLDEPRMEVAHVESLTSARGTQLGLVYELRWELDGERLRVSVDGGAERNVELGGADFFDLGYSPFFNSLPVLRDSLLEHGPARVYRMRFVDVPGLGDSVVEQRYAPLGGRVVHYSSGSFAAEIEFDEDGFVTLYHDFLERVA